MDESNLGCADALLELNDALDEFSKVDSEAAELVRLRLFAGRSIVDAGELLGLSKHSVYKNWECARVWFASQMK